MAPFWVGFLLVGVALVVFRAVKSLMAELIAGLMVIGGMTMIANSANLSTADKATQFVTFMAVTFVGFALVLGALKDDKETTMARVAGLALVVIGIGMLALLAGWPDASGILDALRISWEALKNGLFALWEGLSRLGKR